MRYEIFIVKWDGSLKKWDKVEFRSEKKAMEWCETAQKLMDRKFIHKEIPMTHLERIWEDKLIIINPFRMRCDHKYTGKQGVVLRQTKGGLLLVKFPDEKNPVPFKPKDLMLSKDYRKTLPEITF